MSNATRVGAFSLSFAPQPETIESLRAQIRAYETRLAQFQEQGFQIATVSHVRGNRCMLVTPGGRIEVSKPHGDLGEKMKPGVSVKIMAQSAAIVGLVDYQTASGDAWLVKSTIEGDRVAIETPMGVRVAAVGGKTPKAGDRVVLDVTNSVVVDVIPNVTDNRFALSIETGVRWDDIGGQKEAKAAMREAIEGPFKNAARYQRYGKRPTRGVLLSGPPGCGKTMLGKAAATAIAELHGSKHVGAFMYVKGPEVLDKFMGASEAAIRSIFSAARAHKAAHGYPALVFIDEADAILSKRGTAGKIHSLAEVTIVPQFLAEMDGMEESGAIVVLATNRADSLDPAIVRDGRIDRRVHVGRPSREDAREIVRASLSTRPLEQDDAEVLAEFAVERIFTARNALAEVHVKDSKEPHVFSLGHVVSGAMVVNIVEQATTAAIDRELATGKDLGVSRADLSNAIRGALKQARGIDHSDAFAQFVGELGAEKVISVKKVELDLIH